jgi:Flp pilus assembly protein TadG
MKNNRGQALVEITLIAPLMLLSLYVAMDLGMAFFAAQGVQNAVRDLARIGSASSTFNGTTLKNDLDSRLPNNVTLSSSSVTKLATSPANCTHTVRATATVAYPLFWYRMVGLFGITAPNTISITRTTQMRYQHQPATNGGAGCTA